MKFSNTKQMLMYGKSPSMRREWIEMYDWWLRKIQSGSPSMRREWIEMRY